MPFSQKVKIPQTWCHGYNPEQTYGLLSESFLSAAMYLTSAFGFPALRWAVSFFLGNHILDTLLPIFVANRARVNNFPGAYRTTSRKTMSADRSIEGDGRFNSNVHDFYSRRCVSNKWYKIWHINVFSRDVQEVSIKYIKCISWKLMFKSVRSKSS